MLRRDWCQVPLLFLVKSDEMFVNRCFSAFHIYYGDNLCCNCNKCIMCSRNYSRCSYYPNAANKGLPVLICSFWINWLRIWFSIKLSVARSQRLLFLVCSVCYVSSQTVFKCNKNWRCIAWWKQVHWLCMFFLGELIISSKKSRPGVALML